MSLQSDIKLLKSFIKPKRTLKFVMSQDEVTDEPEVIWVVFTLKD